MGVGRATILHGAKSAAEAVGEVTGVTGLVHRHVAEGVVLEMGDRGARTVQVCYHVSVYVERGIVAILLGDGSYGGGGNFE